jgi:hypothetical protein
VSKKSNVLEACAGFKAYFVLPEPNGNDV